MLHRLELYRSLTGGEAVVPGYADNSCPGECPEGAHCSFGLCFCDQGELGGALAVLCGYFCSVGLRST